MDTDSSATALVQLFGPNVNRSTLATALTHYLKAVLNHQEFAAACSQGLRAGLRDLEEKPYAQAGAFVEALDSFSLSPQATLALRRVLEEEGGIHLLSSGSEFDCFSIRSHADSRRSRSGTSCPIYGRSRWLK